MRMMSEKRGVMNEATLEKAAFAIILLIVVFKLYEVLVPEGQAAGDALNAAGVPLGSLFTSSGIVWLIIMAALVILVIRSFLKGGRK